MNTTLEDFATAHALDIQSVQHLVPGIVLPQVLPDRTTASIDELAAEFTGEADRLMPADDSPELGMRDRSITTQYGVNLGATALTITNVKKPSVVSTYHDFEQSLRLAVPLNVEDSEAGVQFIDFGVRHEGKTRLPNTYDDLSVHIKGGVQLPVPLLEEFGLEAQIRTSKNILNKAVVYEEKGKPLANSPGMQHKVQIFGAGIEILKALDPNMLQPVKKQA